jgi:hypothetical protein
MYSGIGYSATPTRDGNSYGGMVTIGSGVLYSGTMVGMVYGL